jgi:hypothetical protein
MRIVVSLAIILTLSSSIGFAQQQQIKNQNYQGSYYPASKKLVFYENGVWYADSDGVSFWDGNSTLFYNKQNGLELDTVSAIGIDPLDNLVFMGREGVVRKIGSSFEFKALNYIYYAPFLERIEDELWMSQVYPIYKITANESGEFDTIEYRPPNEFYNNIEKDSHGNYYLQSGNLLFKKSGDNDFEWETPMLYISALHVDKSDNVWIASDGVLKVKEYGSNEYSDVSNELINDRWIRAITSDTSGRIFLATNSGLIVIDGNTWSLLDEASGMSSSDCYDVVVDNAGVIWVATKDGISRISGSPDSGEEKISGFVYFDMNHDGVRNNGEPGLKGHFLKLSPGNAFVITDSDGKFSFIPVAGENSVSWHQKDFWAIDETSLEKISFNYPENRSPALQFGLKWETVTDVSVSVTGTAVRPGFDVQYYINYKNEGNVSTNPTVKFEYDGLLTLVESSVQPNRSSDQLLEWDVTNLDYLEEGFLIISFKLPSVTPLGTAIQNNVSIQKLDGENILFNNVDTLHQVVTGSFDPNDKLVKEGVLESNYVLHDTPLTYTIRFQNTGTDTAFTIKVKDTIDPSLSLTSLKMIGSSHPYELSLEDRTLTFEFQNIKLPDSIRNEPASHGYIKYSISPLETLAENTVVKNKADIYFDFNEPVATNEVVNKYVSFIPSGRITAIVRNLDEHIKLYPNPAAEQIIIDGYERSNFSRIEIISATGKKLYESEFKRIIPVGNLNNGMYLIRLYSGKQVASYKIVVDH